MTDEELGSLGSRRDFFKKMLALGFAVPVISSFALEGVASAKPTNKLTSHIAGDQQVIGNGGFCITDPFADPPFELCANQSFANMERPDNDGGEGGEGGSEGEGDGEGGSGGEGGGPRFLRGGRKLLW